MNINFPYLNGISIDRNRESPVYLQIARELSMLMKQGVIKPGQKLPGSRIMAEILKVNRNTISLATDELLTEGWVVARPRSGLFVNEKLPLVREPLKTELAGKEEKVSGIRLEPNPNLQPPQVSQCTLAFNDGVPDPRLSPLNELGREYHRLLKKGGPLSLFGYADAQGEPLLRKLMSRELNEHRGLNTSPENLFISRGSIMAIYLIARATIKPGDGVVTGELSYQTANFSFEDAGARLFRIPVDEKGLDTAALEALLEREKIRMLYITSHHHHPTTVTLAPERRVHLYELARKRGFFILEDDYDFDYHYENKPTLPIAGMDAHGLVVYIGSWSKTIYPGIRTGFVVAPQELIAEMIKYRRISDRQGDHVIERSIANLMHDGTMHRYLRKSKKIYRARKEYFCRLLRERFSAWLDFQEPEGGMAVWVKFKAPVSLPELARICKKKDLYLSDGAAYNPPDRHLNACRMGFAHMTEEEMEKACAILEEAFAELEGSN